ncbi:hypothetical protein ACQE3E_00990 [Methylomonas sp. MED-D]|uniref:hypothetical protein n=1 Tax=unclassified Methylomonas TaxID=2608980 RepID=UPI0028A3D3FC|nr:hypothetical protein [Methylomonas sp. MV1]MDT4330514.1 hypothetical protein [Methylomonas sp. MV1]
MEKLEFGVSDDDRKNLLHFVDTLQKLLGDLIGADQYFLPKFRDDYKRAWRELDPHFYALKDAIQRADTNTLLTHGLLGSPLHLKLKVINHFTEEFMLYGIELVGGHKILEKLLGAVNRLLATVVDTVGTGSPIHTFNELLISIIQDDS